MDEPGSTPSEPQEARRRAGRGVRLLRRTALAVVAIGALGVATLAGINAGAARSAAAVTFDDVDDVPTRPVAIVLGAGVVGDEPSPMLGQRVDAGVALWEAGRVEHLLVTGDNGTVGYDEPTVMRDRALAAGLPRDAVTRDFAGFDTYDSCVRAKEVFGVTAAVIVTQAYHLPRALLLCRSVGIDAVGLALPDWGHRPDEVPFRYTASLPVVLQAREYVATGKAVVDAGLLHPDPRAGGDPVELGSDLAAPGEPGVPVGP